jgi:acyl-CoA synthetase (AMP-forming)/AMP-acid ligase II
MTHSSLLNSVYLSTAFAGNPTNGLKMVCNPVPLFHIFGLATSIIIPLLMGSTTIMPFYFPEIISTMKAIQAYKCNTLRGVPTQFVDLLNHPDRQKYDLSSLENLVLGGRYKNI